MNFVATRVLTYHFKSKDMETAKRDLKSVNLVYAGEVVDTLTCEETGEEILL